MIFRQFVDPDRGCASYVVGCERGGHAAIVDPLADITPYVSAAAAHALRITHVIETHAHADHLSGASRLARLAGAPLLTHEPFASSSPHTDVEDEEEHEVGRVRLTFVHAPGHTIGSMAVIVRDRSRPDLPGRLLSGDTLLVGEVGRPEPELPSDGWCLAEMLYHSIFDRLLTLPDGVLVYPGHVSRVDGLDSSAARDHSTIAAERRACAAWRSRGPREFARRVLAGSRPLGPEPCAIRRRNLGFLSELHA